MKMKVSNLIPFTTILLTVLIVLFSSNIFGAVGDASKAAPWIKENIDRFLETAQQSTDNQKLNERVSRQGMDHWVHYTPDGYLKDLAASSSRSFPIIDRVPGNATRNAQNFMKERASLFGINDVEFSFQPLKSRKRNGRRFERLGQTYNGIPIFGSQVLVQLNEFDGVEFVATNIVRNIGQNNHNGKNEKPVLSIEQVKQLTIDYIKNEYSDDNIEIAVPELNYFAPNILGLEGDNILVWVLETGSDNTPEASRKLLIDGNSGAIVRNYPLVLHALDRYIRDANYQDSWGDLVRTEGDPPSGIVDANDAYEYAASTYYFYRDQHSRDSYDDSGGNIKVTVRYCQEDCPYLDNAYFNDWRNRIYLGGGYVVDDVFAHEYTHGVTSEESELIYENDSGAINESFSDIWGEFVDWKSRTYSLFDNPEYRWLIGERASTEDDTAGARISTYPYFDGAGESKNQCNNDEDDDGDGIVDDGCGEHLFGKEGWCDNDIDDDNDGIKNDGCYERYTNCDDNVDNNHNGYINEGCPETGAECYNGVDDDGDGYVDEGCPGSCNDGIDNGNDGRSDVADSSCYMRDMQHPPAKAHPDKLSSGYYKGFEEIPDKEENDYGGVHSNSGIINKLAYLLTDGDSFNGRDIYGVGMERVADLFYEVQTMPLNSAANYWNLAVALRQAAVNLGWSQADQENLYKALTAVEIFDTIFVDSGYPGTTQTGWIRWPFDTVIEAHDSVPTGGTVISKSGVYPENIRLERKATYKVWGAGEIRIGE